MDYYYLPEFIYRIISAIKLNDYTNPRLLGLAILSTKYSHRFNKLAKYATIYDNKDSPLNNEIFENKPIELADLNYIKSIVSEIEQYKTAWVDLDNNIGWLVKHIYKDLFGYDSQIPSMYYYINHNFEPISKMPKNIKIVKYSYDSRYSRLTIYTNTLETFPCTDRSVLIIDESLDPKIFELDEYVNKINILLRLNSDSHHC